MDQSEGVDTVLDIYVGCIISVCMTVSMGGGEVV